MIMLMKNFRFVTWGHICAQTARPRVIWETSTYSVFFKVEALPFMT